jgi:hypothetical protein
MNANSYTKILTTMETNQNNHPLVLSSESVEEIIRKVNRHERDLKQLKKVAPDNGQEVNVGNQGLMRPYPNSSPNYASNIILAKEIASHKERIDYLEKLVRQNLSENVQQPDPLQGNNHKKEDNNDMINNGVKDFVLKLYTTLSNLPIKSSGLIKSALNYHNKSYPACLQFQYTLKYEIEPKIKNTNGELLLPFLAKKIKEYRNILVSNNSKNYLASLDSLLLSYGISANNLDVKFFKETLINKGKNTISTNSFRNNKAI